MLVALDRARGSLVRIAVRTPLLGTALKKRTSRIAVRAVAAIAAALALTWLAPAATLAVSPLVLGIPHVASSLRYLVVRQRLPRAWLGVLVAFALVLAALRVAEQYVGPAHVFARLEVSAASLLALAIVARSPSRKARIFGAIAVAVAGAAMFFHATGARLLFVHLHNLGAVLVWALVWQKNRALVPIAALAVAIAVVLFGVSPLRPADLGVDLATVGKWLAPGAGAAIALRLVLAHVFTDSVHYAFWLGIIPEETLRNEGTLTFRMSLRALEKDFGKLAVALVAASMVALAIFAGFGAARARDLYFAVAGFHGYVEGAMLTYVLTRRP